MKYDIKLINGKLVVVKESDQFEHDLDESKKLRPVMAKPNSSKDRISKMMDAIMKILKRIKRGELKVSDEKAEQLFERILEMLNKEQQIDAFFDEETSKKDDDERDEIIELIYAFPSSKLTACKNMLKNM